MMADRILISNLNSTSCRSDTCGRPSGLSHPSLPNRIIQRNFECSIPGHNYHARFVEAYIRVHDANVLRMRAQRSTLARSLEGDPIPMELQVGTYLFG